MMAATGGTFTPSTLTWSGDASAKTFTYTPASTGVKTIGFSSSGTPTLTDHDDISYTANEPSSGGSGILINGGLIQ